MKHFVVVVKEEPSGKVRIGTSQTRETQMISGQTWNPDKLSLQERLTRKYDTKDEAKRIKECMHEALKKRGLWIERSWFASPALDLLKEILDDCEKYHGIRPI